MAGYRIDCINKPDRDSRHDRITHAGGPSPDGAGRWKDTVPNIVRFIEGNEHRFYTGEGNGRTWVGVQTSAAGNKYIQTHANGEWNDNLLAQRECRSSASDAEGESGGQSDLVLDAGTRLGAGQSPTPRRRLRIFLLESIHRLGLTGARQVLDDRHSPRDEPRRQPLMLLELVQKDLTNNFGSLQRAVDPVAHINWTPRRH